MNYRTTLSLVIFVFVTFFLAAMSGCSTISIRTAIEIDAPGEKVYAILADLEAYPEWNPYHRNVQGQFSEGAKLAVEVTRPDGKKISIPPHMLRITENQEITWGGGIRGVFYGEHSFILSTTESGGTLLQHNEDFSGFAISFADLPPDVIAEGYHQMNLALKKRAESVNQ